MLLGEGAEAKDGGCAWPASEVRLQGEKLRKLGPHFHLEGPGDCPPFRSGLGGLNTDGDLTPVISPGARSNDSMGTEVK